MKSLALGNRSQLGLRAAVLMMFLLVLAACGGTTTTALNLTDGEWQWQDWTDATGTTAVTNPENYTLQFMGDNTFAGQADCNRIAGSYTRDGNNVPVMPGPSTLAACPEGSLDFVYTSTLAQVTSGEINADNELLLRTADDLTMRFTNTTAPAAAAGTGFLGLPWWSWLLLLGLLGLILWWLFSRGNEPEPAPVAPVQRTVTPPAAAAPVVTEVAESYEAERVGVYDIAGGVADDLTRIEGIGPKISSILAAAGINSFSELGNRSYDDLKRILEAADLRGSYGDPTTWPEQARLAAAGSWAELEALQATLKGGRV
jgi:predicted flap endonuclease-1-like 5' DNA nuclease/heat shock protein HslJ